MKIDLKELKRALQFMESKGTLTEVDMQIVIENRLVMKYTDPMGGDHVTVTLYDSDTEKMADVTVTSRLTSLLK